MIFEIAKLANLDLGDRDILSVNFVGPRVMRRINREFLNHDYLTDVICFNYRSEPDFNHGDIAVEIFISPDIAEERSLKTKGLEYSSELFLYLVHAILHAAGYRDKTSSEKVLMTEREKEIISEINKTAKFPLKES